MESDAFYLKWRAGWEGKEVFLFVCCEERMV